MLKFVSNVSAQLLNHKKSWQMLKTIQLSNLVVLFNHPLLQIGALFVYTNLGYEHIFVKSCNIEKDFSTMSVSSVLQGANRAAEDAERERREREERLRHGRNPGARGMASASGRARAVQDVAAPSPLNPTSHTGQHTLGWISNYIRGKKCCLGI